MPRHWYTVTGESLIGGAISIVLFIIGRGYRGICSVPRINPIRGIPNNSGVLAYVLLSTANYSRVLFLQT